MSKYASKASDFLGGSKSSSFLYSSEEDEDASPRVPGVSCVNCQEAGILDCGSIGDNRYPCYQCDTGRPVSACIGSSVPPISRITGTVTSPKKKKKKTRESGNGLVSDPKPRIIRCLQCYMKKAGPACTAKTCDPPEIPCNNCKNKKDPKYARECVMFDPEKHKEIVEDHRNREKLRKLSGKSARRPAPKDTSEDISKFLSELYNSRISKSSSKALGEHHKEFLSRMTGILKMLFFVFDPKDVEDLLDRQGHRFSTTKRGWEFTDENIKTIKIEHPWFFQAYRDVENCFPELIKKKDTKGEPDISFLDDLI